MTHVQQRDAAREKANMVRMFRMDLKRDIHDRKLTVAEVILDYPPEVRTMRVSQLLNAQYRWGVTRTERLLRSLRISDYQTVEGLTDRQREEIAFRLGSFASAA